MIPSVVLWILAVVGCVLIGREVGKLRSGKTTKLQSAKRAALDLAIKLREAGLKLVPSCLEDLAVGDVNDMIERIHDLATIAQSGNDAILKELDGTYDRVLAAKLRTPEGRAVIRARLIEAEKIVADAAKLAPAVAAAAAVV